MDLIESYRMLHSHTIEHTFPKIPCKFLQIRAHTEAKKISIDVTSLK